MIDKKRLYLMIGLARFKEKNGEGALRINRMFSSDYVGYALMSNIVLITIAYALILGLFALARLEFLLSNLNELNFRPLIILAILGYLILLAVYTVIAYMVARIRYKHAETASRAYEKQLEKLIRSYRQDRKRTRREREEDE